VQPSLQWKNNECYTNWVCGFVALGIRYAVRCDILWSVAYTTLQYVSTLSHKRHDFRKPVTEYKMWVLIFCTKVVWNISHPEKKWATYDENIYWSWYKVPLIPVWFWWNLNILDRFSKYPKISNFMKIRPVGAEFFHAKDGRREGGRDGQTWRS
jgi:hypothetical protein